MQAYIYVGIYVFMHFCIYVHMYVCMYVCVCVCVYITAWNNSATSRRIFTKFCIFEIYETLLRKFEFN